MATSAHRINVQYRHKVSFGKEKQELIEVGEFFADPGAVRHHAELQKFAFINPHYPGVRAPLDPQTVAHWSRALSRPSLATVWGARNGLGGGGMVFSCMCTADTAETDTAIAAYRWNKPPADCPYGVFE